jgi:hypothetical protein
LLAAGSAGQELPARSKSSLERRGLHVDRGGDLDPADRVERAGEVKPGSGKCGTPCARMHLLNTTCRCPTCRCRHAPCGASTYVVAPKRFSGCRQLTPAPARPTCWPRKAQLLAGPSFEPYGLSI